MLASERYLEEAVSLLLQIEKRVVDSADVAEMLACSCSSKSFLVSY